MNTGIGEDYSPQRMQAKREAMIAEYTHRDEALDAREKEAYAKFDPFTDRYTQAVRFNHQAITKMDDAENDLNRAKAIPGVSAEILARRQEAYDAAVKDQAWVQKHTDRTRDEYRAAEKEYIDENHAVQDERRGLNAELRAKYVNAPEPGTASITGYARPQSPDGSYPLSAIPSGQEPQVWKDGMQAVNEIAGNVLPPGKDSVPMAEMHPTDPWFASGRSYQRSAAYGITLNPKAAEWTIVHEMGHQMESVEPNLTSRIWEHIDSRTQGESWQKLKDLTGGNYNDDEVTKPDQFWSQYMGKDYSRQASEFLSMSIQGMYQNPVAFARKDPKSFDFTSQLLAEWRATGTVQPTQAGADAYAALGVERGFGQ